ncbi:MAG: DUF364 domain-containing protein [bacterium]|nr:MAG: DUF364 domain-containing protein [bacterium]
MKILEEILQFIKDDVPISQILVGVHWTAVMSRHAGLASTFCEPPPHHDNQVRDVGQLHKKNARELAQYIFSDRLLEASIGLAAVNSMIDINESLCESVNAYDIIAEKGKGKHIGIIGHFPFIPKLKKEARQLWVFEKRLQEGDLPEEEMKHLLPKCEVVAISATTLINHTFEMVCDCCRKESFKLMLGASTPMLPLLFDYGIDVLSGSKVIDSDLVFSCISQGATFKQISGIKLLSMIATGN